MYVISQIISFIHINFFSCRSFKYIQTTKIMEVDSFQQHRHFCAFFKVSDASRRPYLSPKTGWWFWPSCKCPCWIWFSLYKCYIIDGKKRNESDNTRFSCLLYYVCIFVFLHFLIKSSPRFVCCDWISSKKGNLISHSCKITYQIDNSSKEANKVTLNIDSLWVGPIVQAFISIPPTKLPTRVN